MNPMILFSLRWEKDIEMKRQACANGCWDGGYLERAQQPRRTNRKPKAGSAHEHSVCQAPDPSCR
jgi:hypothetical protein